MVIYNDFFNAGMVVGVGVPSLITTAIFIVICIARRRRHTLKTGGKCDTILEIMLVTTIV